MGDLTNHNAEEHRGIYLLVLFCIYLNYAFSFLIPFMCLLLISLHGLSQKQALISTGTAFLLSGLLQPWAGTALDRGYYRELIIVGTLALVTGLFSFLGPSASYVSLFLSLTGFLFGTAVFQTVTTQFLEGAVSSSFRSTSATLYAVAGNLGWVTCSATAYFFLSERRRELLFLDGLTTIILGITLMIAYARLGPSSPVSDRSVARRSTRPSKHLLTSAWRPLVGHLCFNLVIATQFSIIPVIYARLGLDAERSTAVMTGISAGIVSFLGLLFAKKAKSFGRGRIALVAASGLLALGHSLVPTSSGLYSIAVITGIWGVGEILSYPIASVLLYSSVSRADAGRLTGLKVLLMRFSFFVVPLLGSLLQALPLWSYSLLFGTLALIPIFLLWNQVSNQATPSAQ